MQDLRPAFSRALTSTPLVSAHRTVLHRRHAQHEDTAVADPLYHYHHQPSIHNTETSHIHLLLSNTYRYSAPPNPTANLSPCAHGSASELFKCVVKKPDVVQLEINGEMQSNASDVTVQFLAELRVYTTVSRHRNICAFLGSLENVGMVLEYIDGRTLYDVVKERPPLTRSKKIDYHDQLLDGLTHLHSFGLSHGDLSLLNVQVTIPADTVKLLDFGRSKQPLSSRKTEQIHPGTRPFCAPEILRGECQDALLADAYSFGIILVCLDRCESVDIKPWDQRKDLIPKDFFAGCDVFDQRAREYLRKWNASRRRLVKEDILQPRFFPSLVIA
ncbi:kinase-like domain-containing protein [Mucidula mucida]|nr:kinase-like domain-containing protein [Mucidula mucida]